MINYVLPSSPASSVCPVLSITMRATLIAELMFLKHPTEPTSMVFLQELRFFYSTVHKYKLKFISL